MDTASHTATNVLPVLNVNRINFSPSDRQVKCANAFVFVRLEKGYHTMRIGNIVADSEEARAGQGAMALHTQD